MSQAGLQRRTSRIFKRDGRSVIIAMDHTSFMPGPMPGLGDPSELIRKVVAGGADAVMMPAGSVGAAFDAIGDAGLILSVNTAQPGLEKQVEAALQLGADAIKCMLYPWWEGHEGTGEVSWLGAEARRWGMPFMVETVPGGFNAGAEMRTPERVAAAARIGVELGATMIKTFYPGTAVGMKTVVDYTPVPVVILGGQKAEDERALLASVKEAVDGGAHGVAIGRNIWQHPTPDRMAAAIASIVHGGVTVEEAYRELA